MAHFAEIDGAGGVLRVLVVGNDQEHRGQEFLANDLGLGGTWVQCSYNATIRKNYPGPGFTYDAGRDAFIAPKPFPSWLLDEATCQWGAPVAPPDNGERYRWDEGTLTWVQS
jgi:hypothetical protein